MLAETLCATILLLLRMENIDNLIHDDEGEGGDEDDVRVKNILVDTVVDDVDIVSDMDIVAVVAAVDVAASPFVADVD